MFPFKKKKLNKTREGKLVSVLKKFEITHFLDIGANIGQTHDLLRNAGFKGNIISFEPGPRAHDILSAKASQDPQWQIAPRLAIGAEQGELELNVSESSDMSSLLPATANLLETLPRTKTIETVKTNVVPIDDIYDDYCPKGSNVFLKADTQGYEEKLLEGAKNSLKKIRGIQLELSLFELYKGEQTYLPILNFLHSEGFEPYMIVETNFSRKLVRQLQIDVVFCRPDCI